MTNVPDPNAFARVDEIDQPSIVGAAWWQKNVQEVSPVSRRVALTALLAGAGVIALGGIAFAVASGSGSGDNTSYDNTQVRRALEMQREYGWDFGASGDTLVFDGKTRSAFDRAKLSQLVTDLAPGSDALQPYFVPTLLESVDAKRRTVPSGDPAPFAPVGDALIPIFTSQMGEAFRSGRALAALVSASTVPPFAVIVDLDGPEAIAFAAGASDAFDPVLLLDNWPHPRGVVRSHLTLAAAAYFQPLFASARLKKKRHALFVLDEARMSKYVDNAALFDNRYLARIPSAARLKELGLLRCLYVVKKLSTLVEADDLNEEFTAAAAAGIKIRMLALGAFGRSADDAPENDATSAQKKAGATLDAGAAGAAPWPDKPPHYYGFSPVANTWFWKDYPELQGTASAGAREPSFERAALRYVPTPRATSFSRSATGSTFRTAPTGFGTVPVVVAVGTGLIVGAAMSRSGSWTRSSGWGGG